MPIMEKKEELKKNIINVHQRLGTEAHITAEEMDKERMNTITYDYLCRLEEAKNWIEEITKVPESFEAFEEEMRKGVFLAEVAKHFSPKSVGSIFIDSSLQYRHTDNINFFLKSLIEIGLPKYFYFEVIDLYEKKNFPKVVYCIHALAHFLREKGMTGGIVSASGKVFNSEDVERMDNELSNIKMPRFENIKNDMKSYKESEEDEDLEVLKNKVRKELLKEENLIIESNDRHEDNDLSIEEKIALKIKSFLYAKSFNDIIFLEDVSVFSIRKFMFLFFKKSAEMIKEKSIDDLHRKITDKLREIYNKEIYLEDIENRIRLIIHNKLDLYKIEYKRPYEDYFHLKPVQDILQVLQTNPKLLSELCFLVDDKENFICTVVLPLFNFVSGIKEEYLFYHLLEEVFYDNSLSHSMIVNYFRVSREGEKIKQGLYSIVKNLENIEVECNPTEIHRHLYGIVKSLDESLDNKRVSEIYETRLSVIRGVLKSIFDFIQENIHNIPFVIRNYLKIIGTENFLKDFIYPFFLAADIFDTQNKISNMVRNKAYKIVNLMTWFIEKYSNEADPNILVKNSIPEDMTVYLPINDFLKDLFSRYNNILLDLVSIQTPEQYFQLDSLNELARVQKSVIYLPVRVVNGLVQLIRKNQELFDPSLIEDLNVFPDDKNVLLTFSFINSDWVNRTDEHEIALENFIKKTKKKLIYLIKICKGRNIMDLLLNMTTEEEIVNFEKSFINNGVTKNDYESEYNDMEYNTIDDLKDSLHDDLRFLEEKGIVSKNNLYSEMLSLLAQDIISLKLASLERSKELKINETTYNNLLVKEDYLDKKVLEYDEYINSYCSRMAIKKIKYDYNSPIVKLNKESKYGSYYFTATELFKKSILQQIYDVPDLRDIFFIIVSNKPLVFELEIYINNLLISNPYDFRFEDILAMKKDKLDTFNVLNICSFNTENFIKMLNEKYIVIN